MTNSELKQRATMDNRGRKMCMLLSVCMAVLALNVTWVATSTKFKAGCGLFDVDPEINPCDDFYSYACNVWDNQNPRPDWSTEWNVDAMVQERIIKSVVDILGQAVRDDDLKVIIQAKDLYQKCLLNDDDHSSSDFFVQNMWKSLGGVYGKGLQTGEPFPARSEVCAALVHKHFQFALVHTLLQHKYKYRLELENILTEIHFMFTFIEHAFDKEKTGFFNESMEDSKSCADYAHWILSPSEVELGYSSLNLNSSESFLEQMAHISGTGGDLFSEPFQNYECHMWFSRFPNPQLINYHVWYEYLQNRVFDSLLFDSDKPRAVNYGSLGTMISSLMAQSYREGQNKFGRSILDERVDIQRAYEGLAGKGHYIPQYTPSGMCRNKSPNRFTQDQLFFLGYAQTGCQSSSNHEMQYVMQRKALNPDVYESFRALQIFKVFAKAWNCPLGSNMNPTQLPKQII